MNGKQFCARIDFQRQLDLKILIWQKAEKYIYSGRRIKIALVSAFVDIRDDEMIFFCENYSEIPRANDGTCWITFASEVIEELFF